MLTKMTPMPKVLTGFWCWWQPLTRTPGDVEGYDDDDDCAIIVLIHKDGDDVHHSMLVAPRHTDVCWTAAGVNSAAAAAAALGCLVCGSLQTGSDYLGSKMGG